jgi:hypothetical protein
MKDNNQLHAVCTISNRVPDQWNDGAIKQAKEWIGKNLFNEILKIQGDRYVKVYVKEEVGNPDFHGHTQITYSCYLDLPGSKKELKTRLAALQIVIQKALLYIQHTRFTNRLVKSADVHEHLERLKTILQIGYDESNNPKED